MQPFGPSLFAIGAILLFVAIIVVGGVWATVLVTTILCVGIVVFAERAHRRDKEYLESAAAQLDVESVELSFTAAQWIAFYDYSVRRLRQRLGGGVALFGFLALMAYFMPEALLGNVMATMFVAWTAFSAWFLHREKRRFFQTPRKIILGPAGFRVLGRFEPWRLPSEQMQECRTRVESKDGMLFLHIFHVGVSQDDPGRATVVPLPPTQEALARGLAERLAR